MGARIIIAITAPFFLIFTFIAELWREVRRAPWYAWNACQQEMESIRAAWRAKSIDPENWK